MARIVKTNCEMINTWGVCHFMPDYGMTVNQKNTPDVFFKYGFVF